MHHRVVETHFNRSLQERDPEIHRALIGELNRQHQQIELIASENSVSLACLQTLGSVITNKTVEGYPGDRFHGGAAFADVVERAAIGRARQVFECAYANVQPHSGSQANQSVLFALLAPGGRVLSMDLAAGGHLSHGAPAHQSGRCYEVSTYGVDRDTHRIDYDEVERLAVQAGPEVIIAGGSSYPRVIDFARLRVIADRVQARLVVDMAHFAGLVAAGVHPSPLPFSDVVTCTTTKTLRGPRGGLILTNDETLATRLQGAVFPGVQGSIHLQSIAAKAVTLGEALQPAFKTYGAEVLANARTLAEQLRACGIRVITGGTDTHLVLTDVSTQGVSGQDAQKLLEQAGITSNKNPVPFDDRKPSRWKGLRLGAAAGTTRGFGEGEFREIAQLIASVLEAAGRKNENRVIAKVRERALELSAGFPIYPLESVV